MPIEHRDWTVAKSASRSLPTSRVLTAQPQFHGLLRTKRQIVYSLLFAWHKNGSNTPGNRT